MTCFVMEMKYSYINLYLSAVTIGDHAKIFNSIIAMAIFFILQGKPKAECVKERYDG